MVSKETTPAEDDLSAFFLLGLIALRNIAAERLTMQLASEANVGGKI